MAFYECVFIARQDISVPQTEALADHFTKVIEDNGGAVAQREYWGLRSLAFRIRKNRKGHYMLLNVDAPAAAMHEVDRQMRINEDIVRHLTVRVEAIKPGPSAMLQSRASREDRPRREGRDDRRDDRPRRDDRGPRSFGDDEGGGEREFSGRGEREFSGRGERDFSGRGDRGDGDFSGPGGR